MCARRFVELGCFVVAVLLVCAYLSCDEDGQHTPTPLKEQKPFYADSEEFATFTQIHRSARQEVYYPREAGPSMRPERGQELLRLVGELRAVASDEKVRGIGDDLLLSAGYLLLYALDRPREALDIFLQVQNDFADGVICMQWQSLAMLNSEYGLPREPDPWKVDPNMLKDMLVKYPRRSRDVARLREAECWEKMGELSKALEIAESIIATCPGPNDLEPADKEKFRYLNLSSYYVFFHPVTLAYDVKIRVTRRRLGADKAALAAIFKEMWKRGCPVSVDEFDPSTEKTEDSSAPPSGDDKASNGDGELNRVLFNSAKDNDDSNRPLLGKKADTPNAHPPADHPAKIGPLSWIVVTIAGILGLLGVGFAVRHLIRTFRDR